ncbi:MAG: hypothetical protein IKD76_03875 [Clostridia bacterium]|nr:hypothetical protein [Clostridia bacterium]
MTNRNKILIGLIIISTLAIGFLLFKLNTKETVMDTYILNQQGFLKNEKYVLDEKFDEKGNLIYYKYKSPDSNNIYEFNYNYNYDDKNRIIEVSLDNKDSIQIEYNESNQIAKIKENISNPSSNTKDLLEFSFQYLQDDGITVDKKIINSVGSENEHTQHYTLSYNTIDHNNKKCILLTETNDDGVITFELLYEKNSNNINYSNFYELLNIIPFGYYSNDNSFKDSKDYNNSLLLLRPVPFNGNIIYANNYIKVNQYSDYMKIGANNYYDNSNRLLKQESSNYETNQITYCMYKTINSKEYYEYRLVKIYSSSSAEYTYIKNKIYLDDNNQVYKKETLKSDKINEKDYTSKLKEFEKYFNNENI